MSTAPLSAPTGPVVTPPALDEPPAPPAAPAPAAPPVLPEPPAAPTAQTEPVPPVAEAPAPSEPPAATSTTEASAAGTVKAGTLVAHTFLDSYTNEEVTRYGLAVAASADEAIVVWLPEGFAQLPLSQLFPIA